jgi:hypothetical protein
MPTSGQIKQLLCRVLELITTFCRVTQRAGPHLPPPFSLLLLPERFAYFDSATATWPLRLTVQSIRAWRVSIPYLRR